MPRSRNLDCRIWRAVISPVAAPARTWTGVPGRTIAAIEQDLWIECGLCYLAREDTSHQSIRRLEESGARRYGVVDEERAGCTLCMQVWPMEGFIDMVEVEYGEPSPNRIPGPNDPMHRDVGLVKVPRRPGRFAVEVSDEDSVDGPLTFG